MKIETDRAQRFSFAGRMGLTHYSAVIPAGAGVRGQGCTLRVPADRGSAGPGAKAAVPVRCVPSRRSAGHLCPSPYPDPGRGTRPKQPPLPPATTRGTLATWALQVSGHVYAEGADGMFYVTAQLASAAALYNHRAATDDVENRTFHTLVARINPGFGEAQTVSRAARHKANSSDSPSVAKTATVLHVAVDKEVADCALIART